jgi:hypothetical protein
MLPVSETKGGIQQSPASQSNICNIKGPSAQVYEICNCFTNDMLGDIRNASAQEKSPSGHVSRCASGDVHPNAENQSRNPDAEYGVDDTSAAGKCEAEVEIGVECKS